MGLREDSRGIGRGRLSGIVVITIDTGRRRVSAGRQVQQVHRGRGRSLGRHACQLTTDTSLARLRVVALDASDGAGPTGVRNPAGARRGGCAAALLGRVVVVVGHMATEKVLAGKRLLADVAYEAATKRVRLDMPDEMLRAGVRPPTVTAGVEIGAAMICSRARGRRRGRG